MSNEMDTGYQYPDHLFNTSHACLMPLLDRVLDSLKLAPGNKRIFDLGCGNGSVASHLASKGYDVTGIDPSVEGIAQARANYPRLKLHAGSANDDLKSHYGTFPVVLSLEVVEHVYSPRTFARCAFDLLDDNGTAIVSTPYHGYVKNLALALTGKLDDHFTALWDHGHIKFWSVKTLGTLLKEAGFADIRFLFAGRVPMLAKSMIAVARKKPA